VRELTSPARTFGFLSRRAQEELGSLQANVHSLGISRDMALRILVASRHATTTVAQHEFYLEFSWVDQEYREAVRRLAQFCRDHRGNVRLTGHAGRLESP
jgi:hypothetical protein